MNKLPLLFFLLLSPFLSAAQLEFGEEEFLSAVSDANIGQSALMADMDGDGDNDIVATGINGPIWYKNMDGEGNFGKKILIPTGTRTFLLQLADMDGDQDIDLIYTTTYAGVSSLYWIANTDGQGNFEVHSTIDSTLDEPTDLVATDLDGDGDIDLAIADNDLQLFAWYENSNGLGDFSTRQVFYDVAESATSLRAFDMDGDGDQDLLATWGYIGDTYQKVGWFRNLDGMGNFSSPILISSVNFRRPESAFAADFDGDGDLDVVAASFFDPDKDDPLYESGWFENLDGQGSFGSMNLIDRSPMALQVIRSFDLDEDGDQDIVIGTHSTTKKRLIFYENQDGKGTFAPATIIDSLSQTSSEIQSVKINSDEHLDLLSYTNSDDGIIWYKKENSLAEFSARKIITKSDFRSSVIQKIDWDDDGDSDILAFAYGKIGWFENVDSMGTLSELQVIAKDIIGLHSYTKLADLNGDGELDLIYKNFVNATGHIHYWRENLGDFAAFGSPKILTVCDFYKIIDYDQDGDLDIVYADNDIIDKIGYLENLDGLGTFASPKVLFSVNSSEIEAFFTYDVDNDGDLDIIYSDQSRTYWRKRLADGSLSSPVTIDFSSKYLLARNDIDADGLADLYIRKNGIRHYKYNATTAMFELVTTYPTSIWSIDFADVDHDGDQDIISIPPINTQGVMAWLENSDGLGTFVTPTQTSTNTVQSNGRGFAADLNLDGRLELYFSFLTWAKVVRYPNVTGIPLQVKAVQFDPFNCESSFVQITATGGTPPYLYRLNNGPFQQGNTFKLPVGHSAVFDIQDVSGSIIQSDSLRAPLPDYPQLQATVNGNDVTLSGTGGLPNYHFSINDSNFALGHVFANLNNGFHTAYLHDNLLCYDTLDFVLANTPLNYNTPSISVQSCTTSVVKIEATGGIPPYLFSLDSINFQQDNLFEVPTNDTFTCYIQDTLLNTLSFDLYIPSNEPTLSLEIIDNHLTLFATGGTPGYRYSIDGINFQSSNQFTNLPEGDYTATVQDSLACMASLPFSVLINSTIDAAPSHFKLYPNPSEGQFQLRFPTALEKGMTLSILNLKGQVIYQTETDAKPANTPIELDLTQFTNGIYLLQFSYQNFIERQRIIIMK